MLNYILLYSARAAVFLSAGLSDAALEWSKKAMAFYTVTDFHRIYFSVVLAVAICAKIHWECKAVELLIDDLQAFSRLQDTYPLAGMLLAKCIDAFGLSVSLNATTDIAFTVLRHMNISIVLFSLVLCVIETSGRSHIE